MSGQISQGCFSKPVDQTLKEICFEIEKRYKVHFLEIGTDKDHVHFLVQSVPGMSETEIITLVKSLTAREIFLKHPEVKKKLWGKILDRRLLCAQSQQVL